MEYRAGITRSNIIVASICVFLLLIALVGISNYMRTRLRKQARSAICISDLKSLTVAWGLYVDDNDGKMVNGMAGKDREEDGIVIEKAWTGKDWAEGYELGAQLPQQSQEQAIEAGPLFQYGLIVTAYRCPNGLPGQMRTYSIVDSMNGVPRPRTQEDKVWVNKTTDIRDLPPSRRLVFVDVGRVIPESFAVHYDKEQWWALAPARHGDGTNVSFADGHTEYWKWQASETVRLGKSADHDPSQKNVAPETRNGKEDLHRFQVGVWGKLGYTPGS